MEKTYKVPMKIVEKLREKMHASCDEEALGKALALALVVAALANENGKINIRDKTIVI